MAMATAMRSPATEPLHDLRGQGWPFHGNPLRGRGGLFLRSWTIGRHMKPLCRAMLAGLACMASATAIAQEGQMTKTARGEFTVSLKPLELEGAESSDKRGRMSIDKRITGDLVATTHGQMLTAMSEVQGSAVYVAIERVTGTLEGRHGSFVLHHRGVVERGQSSLSVSVAPDSGTGGLAGIAGDFRIILEDGQHAYEFAYSLPDAE